MRNLKSNAFTLAEVLITLVIIGVIAAMTIPTLMGSTNQQELRSGYNKVFSALNNAMAMEYSLYGNNIVNSENVSVDSYRIAQMISNHLSVIDQYTDNNWLYLNLADGNKIWLSLDSMNYGYPIIQVGSKIIECDASNIEACEKTGSSIFHTRAFCGSVPSHQFCPASANGYAYLYNMTIQEAIDKHNGNYWL